MASVVGRRVMEFVAGVNTQQQRNEEWVF